MHSQLAAIVDTLTSDSIEEIRLGLFTLDALLYELVPSIRKKHESGASDDRLAAFISAQDNFKYNVASAMVLAYRTFSDYHENVQNETILLANRLLLGLLLIHPESRNTFGYRRNMRLMVLLLDPENPLFLVELCDSFISLLMHILLQNVRNMRVFEQCGGCHQVIRHLDPQKGNGNNAAAQQHLYFKVVEFLIFYLTDESGLGDDTRTIQEKAGLFRPDFPGIDDILANLNDLTSL